MAIATDAEARQLINTFGPPSLGVNFTIQPGDIDYWRQEIDRAGYTQASVLLNAIARSNNTATLPSVSPIVPVATPTVEGILDGTIFGIDKKLLLIAAGVYLVFGMKD